MKWKWQEGTRENIVKANVTGYAKVQGSMTLFYGSWVAFRTPTLDFKISSSRVMRPRTFRNQVLDELVLSFKEFDLVWLWWEKWKDIKEARWDFTWLNNSFCPWPGAGHQRVNNRVRKRRYKVSKRSWSMILLVEVKSSSLEWEGKNKQCLWSPFALKLCNSEFQLQLFSTSWSMICREIKVVDSI